VTSVEDNIVDYLNSHLDKESIDGFHSFLKASNATASDRFGWETAISDDGLTLAVLARYAPHQANDGGDDGAVYVYRRDSGVWQEIAILQNTNTSGYYFNDIDMSADGRRIVALNRSQALTFDVAMDGGTPLWESWSLVNTYSHGNTTNDNVSVALSADGQTLVTSDYGYNSNQGRMRIHQYDQDAGWVYRKQHLGLATGVYLGYYDAIDVSADGRVIAVSLMGKTHLVVMWIS